MCEREREREREREYHFNPLSPHTLNRLIYSKYLSPCLYHTHTSTTDISNVRTYTLGKDMGDDPVSGRPVLVRSGRFGRYMQIGLDSEKNKTTHSLPQVRALLCTDSNSAFNFMHMEG